MFMNLVYIDMDVKKEFEFRFNLAGQRSLGEDAPLWQKVSEIAENNFPFQLIGTAEDIREFLTKDLELRKECANDIMVWGSTEVKTTEYWYQFRNGVLRSLQGWQKLYDAKARWFRAEKEDIERTIDNIRDNG